MSSITINDLACGLNEITFGEFIFRRVKNNSSFETARLKFLEDLYSMPRHMNNVTVAIAEEIVEYSQNDHDIFERNAADVTTEIGDFISAKYEREGFSHTEDEVVDAYQIVIKGLVSSILEKNDSTHLVKSYLGLTFFKKIKAKKQNEKRKKEKHEQSYRESRLASARISAAIEDDEKFPETKQSNSSNVVAHVLDPIRGYEKQAWVIEEDIPLEVFNRLSENGDIFVVTNLEQGHRQSVVCDSTTWIKTKKKMDSIDEAGKHQVEEMRNRFKEIGKTKDLP